jgi:biotin carboxyl carrier protein
LAGHTDLLRPGRFFENKTFVKVISILYSQILLSLSINSNLQDWQEKTKRTCHSLLKELNEIINSTTAKLLHENAITSISLSSPGMKATIGKRSFNIEKKDGIIIDGEKTAADIFEYQHGKFHVILDNKSYVAELLSIDHENKSCEVKVGHSIMNVALTDRFDELLHEMGIDEAAGKKVNDIKAPMPGMVLKVMVKNGQPIQKGDALVILEAMKMENILKSPADGIVKKILVSKGDKVEKNQVMVNME